MLTPAMLLQRLTQLRLASIGVWLFFLYYLGLDNVEQPKLTHFLLGLYALLFILGTWHALKFKTLGWHLLAHFIVECQLLTLLLFLNGGVTNPLISYFLVLIVLAAYGLPKYQAWFFILLTVVDYSLLTQWHLPLASHLPNGTELFDVHLVGMWFTFVVSALIFALLISILVHTSRQQLQEIQNLREKQLKNEQLIGIATLAAGTTHELGTPLMTMHMLLSELTDAQSLAPEDVEILKLQVERCRKALQQLAQAGRTAQQEHHHSATDWLDTILNRWRLSHPKANWHAADTLADAHIPSSPLLDQALLNLLDNAAEAGDQVVELSSQINAKYWQLDIIQNDAHAAETLHRQHDFSTEKTYGMGMGLYLSNASVEQFGGTIHLQAQANGGSLCTLRLPLHSPIV